MSSIPPNDPARACSSSFRAPINQEDTEAARNLAETVENINCIQIEAPLTRIRYRIGDHDSDVSRHVIRWDTRPHQEILVNGFQAWPQQNTPDITYYNLLQFIRNSGAPGDTNRLSRHGFVSTTISLTWEPSLSTRTVPVGAEIYIYRYEIYAPGGIWVPSTLAGQFQYESQSEVCFVAGIANQYIRAAQLYICTRPPGSMHATIRRANEEIIINRHFNPSMNDNLFIQKPIHYYEKGGGDKKHWSLNHREFPPPPPMRRKRQVSNYNIWEEGEVDAATTQWYANDVVDVSSYIDAAIRSSRTNEAYIFMKNEYVLLNYAPHSTGDRIVNGPLLICDGFPSLIDTPFGEYGIDCAFNTAYNSEAFIFSINLCACIDYAPGTTNDRILIGPKTIASMFPFFEGTAFEYGVDAAFSSTVTDEAYLFQGDRYALINYAKNELVTNIQCITDGFRYLRNTKFATGIDGAFASHIENEVYIFKEDEYALISFTPHTTDGYMIDHKVKSILRNWPSLASILPRKNGGLDVYEYKNHGHSGDHHDL